VRSLRAHAVRWAFISEGISEKLCGAALSTCRVDADQGIGQIDAEIHSKKRMLAAQVLDFQEFSAFGNPGEMTDCTISRVKYGAALGGTRIAVN